MESTRPLPRSLNALCAVASCCAFALVGNAAAQVSSTDMETPPLQSSPGLNGEGMPGQGTYSQAMSGGGEVERPSARGLFAITIATLVAQGIGSGLSQGLGGSIVKWFHGGDDTAKSTPSNVMNNLNTSNTLGATNAPSDQPAMASLASPSGPIDSGETPRLSVAQSESAFESTATADAPGALHAGIAYEVHGIGRDGKGAPVDPLRHVFRTNDRFQVHYRPTLPGRIEVVNISPDGGESRIDTTQAAAGELATLGPYQFVGAGGKEILRIVLRPCSTHALMVASRKIVRVSTAEADRPVPLAGCDDVGTRSIRARPRSIKKVGTEGMTAFALDRVSSEEIADGSIAARAVTIHLRHR